MKSKNGIFLAIIVTYFVLLFVVTYANFWIFSRQFWNETRTYMVFYIGAGITLVLIAPLSRLYIRNANRSFVIGALAVFGVALWLVRSQQASEHLSWRGVLPPHASDTASLSARSVPERAEITVEVQ